MSCTRISTWTKASVTVTKAAQRAIWIGDQQCSSSWLMRSGGRNTVDRYLFLRMCRKTTRWTCSACRSRSLGLGCVSGADHRLSSMQWRKRQSCIRFSMDHTYLSSSDRDRHEILRSIDESRCYKEEVSKRRAVFEAVRIARATSG